MFSRNNFGDSASSLLKRARDKGESTKIKALTFYSFFSNYGLNTVNFIKIDVEGAEFDILLNTEQALQRVGSPTLLIAFHIGYLKEALLYKKIKNRFLAKVLLKFKKYLFNKEVDGITNSIFEALSFYSHISTSEGLKIDPKEFVLREDQQLIFTNKA